MKADSREKRYGLMKVALGEAEADLAIIGGDIVNVYTAEVVKNLTVLIKGDRIAYVGELADKAITSHTEVIDAKGKVLIPGFIDGHTHIDSHYSISELVKFAIKGGTTTIVTETSDIGCVLGYEGVMQFIRSARNQPVKIFTTVPPVITISPVTEKNSGITVSQVRKLLKLGDVVGLGEAYWAAVLNGNDRVLELIAETIKAGKRVEGHSSGANGNKLQAYISAGISSCHEPITAEEILERLRLGLFVLIREGEVRRELETVAKIKDEKIDFSRLAVSSDGLGAEDIISYGYMDFIVQKAIDLGFAPVLAVQMTTLNVARHFNLGDHIGGIAPGRYADILVIPDLKTIKADYVISNGRVVAKDGEVVVPPRKHRYPGSLRQSITRKSNFTARDFAVPVAGSRSKVKVRVIGQITELLTREAVMDMPVIDGELKCDLNQDILKVAAIERSERGKSFTGFIRGTGLKKGAIAVSTSWDCSDIIVLGTGDADMAGAINRVIETGGGVVVFADGKILIELSLPVAGLTSLEPMEVIAAKQQAVRKAATDLGFKFPDICLTMAVLTTPAIPHLRICESGLFNLRQNGFVSLIME